MIQTIEIQVPDDKELCRVIAGQLHKGGFHEFARQLQLAAEKEEGGEQDERTEAEARQAVLGLAGEAVVEGQQVLGTCSPADLLPILHAYRAQVAKAWSPATAKPGYDAEPGTPAGQCGVTSAWLKERLFLDHDVDTVYYTGRVWIGEKAISADHAWLQYGDVVIDLTGDQFGLEPVVCGYRDYLFGWYAGRPGKRPLKRLAVLLEAMS